MELARVAASAVHPAGGDSGLMSVMAIAFFRPLGPVAAAPLLRPCGGRWCRGRGDHERRGL